MWRSARLLAALSLLALDGLLAGCSWPLCDETCPDGNRCIDGQCLPDPCKGKTCGPDGYGGSCGSCAGVCRDGQCKTCNKEMARILEREACIDRYEASPGLGGMAVSEHGRAPWNRITWAEAHTACAVAGKRLCTKEEWTAACKGTQPCEFYCAPLYPYGPEYVHDKCYGAALASEPKRTGPIQTGSYQQCEGGIPGVYDLSGNVREWVGPCGTSSCKTLGGSYLDSGSSLSCSAEESEYSNIRVPKWSGTEGLDIGFRCCTDL